MGLFSGLMGHATNMKIEEAEKSFGFLLADDEHFAAAYKLIRDVLLFTPNRLILVDVQGVTGKRKQAMSIPYRSITHFSVESAGHFDLDAELKIWIAGCEHPLSKPFNTSVNIYEVQALLAKAIASIYNS